MTKPTRSPKTAVFAGRPQSIQASPHLKSRVCLFFFPLFSFPVNNADPTTGAPIRPPQPPGHRTTNLTSTGGPGVVFPVENALCMSTMRLDARQGGASSQMIFFSKIPMHRYKKINTTRILYIYMSMYIKVASKTLHCDRCPRHICTTLHNPAQITFQHATMGRFRLILRGKCLY